MSQALPTIKLLMEFGFCEVPNLISDINIDYDSFKTKWKRLQEMKTE